MIITGVFAYSGFAINALLVPKTSRPNGAIFDDGFECDEISELKRHFKDRAVIESSFYAN